MSRNCDRDVGLLFCLVWRDFILCFSIRGNISFLTKTASVCSYVFGGIIHINNILLIRDIQ